MDGRHFPNLALMKLSAWHKAQGDAVEWWNGFTHYDRVSRRQTESSERLVSFSVLFIR